MIFGNFVGLKENNQASFIFDRCTTSNQGSDKDYKSRQETNTAISESFLNLLKLWLKAKPVVAWRLAEMLGAVTAEVRERCKIHKFCYLGEGQVFIIQIVF